MNINQRNIASIRDLHTRVIQQSENWHEAVMKLKYLDARGSKAALKHNFGFALSSADCDGLISRLRADFGAEFPPTLIRVCAYALTHTQPQM